MSNKLKYINDCIKRDEYANKFSFNISEDGLYRVDINNELFGYGFISFNDAIDAIYKYYLRFQVWHKMNWFSKYIIHSGLKCFVSRAVDRSSHECLAGERAIIYYNGKVYCV